MLAIDRSERISCELLVGSHCLTYNGLHIGLHIGLCFVGNVATGERV